MQNFIVLGQIPGTNFETTFNFWLTLSLALILLFSARRLWRKRYSLLAFIRARKIERLMTHHQLRA